MRLGSRKIVHRAGERLRSEKGASLPLVLFLFLICAMASAIVLAAATASTGRFAQLTESDRMYYSASSAASFMKDYLEKSGDVVVTRSCKQNGTTYEFTGTVTSNGTTKQLPASASSLTFIEKISACAVFGSSEITETTIAGTDENGWQYPDEGAAEGWVDGFPCSGIADIINNATVSVDGTGLGGDLKELLESKMHADIDAYGDLVITITKLDSADSNNFSQMTLVCQPGFETSTSTAHEADGSIVTTETIHLTWSVSEVSKGTVGSGTAGA